MTLDLKSLRVKAEAYRDILESPRMDGHEAMYRGAIFSAAITPSVVLALIKTIEEQKDLMERMVRISNDPHLFARAVQDQAES